MPHDENSIARRLRPLLLSTGDSDGGAARAAYRLHRGLRSIGVPSGMLVQSKQGDDPTVFGPESKLGKAAGMVRPHVDRLPLGLYPRRKPVIFSPALLPDRVAAQVRRLDPDVVHLHWVAGGFLRIETLERFEKPIVWTLHDSWAFTGGCHVPYDCLRYRAACGACPTLGSVRDGDLSRHVWRRKKRAWRALPLTIVTPSRWLAECARSSSLFRDVPTHVIPNGIDLDRFRPIDKQQARDLLRLAPHKKLILFGAVAGTALHYKGFHLLTRAVAELARDGWAERAELVVFGGGEPADAPELGMPTHYAGRLHDDISLALFYAAADVMVVPSIQEAFGQTASEAMACGTPVVAFAATGLLDIVQHMRTGYLARPWEATDLARGIAWVLEDDARRVELCRAARARVEREFEIARVARQYESLYNSVALPRSACAATVPAQAPGGRQACASGVPSS